jgi:hypothetical protein
MRTAFPMTTVLVGARGQGNLAALLEQIHALAGRLFERPVSPARPDSANETAQDPGSPRRDSRASAALEMTGFALRAPLEWRWLTGVPSIPGAEASRLDRRVRRPLLLLRGQVVVGVGVEGRVCTTSRVGSHRARSAETQWQCMPSKRGPPRAFDEVVRLPLMTSSKASDWHHRRFRRALRADELN